MSVTILNGLGWGSFREMPCFKNSIQRIVSLFCDFGVRELRGFPFAPPLVKNLSYFLGGSGFPFSLNPPHAENPSYCRSSSVG